MSLSLSNNRESIKHLVAGGFGAAVGAILLSPLDVIRTQFQAINRLKTFDKNPLFNTFITIKHFYKTEGLRSLYKGLGPTLCGVVPSKAIYFVSYNQFKTFFSKNRAGEEQSSITHLKSSALAGIITTTTMNPLWMIKTRLQLQTKDKKEYKNSIDCGIKILKGEGIRGLYKGLLMSYVGTTETVLQFVIYEKLKQMFKDKESNNNNGTGSIVLSAAVSKSIATAISYPHEVIRTRTRQSNNVSKIQTTQIVKSILMESKGIMGLYSGLCPHLLRTVPNACVLFVSYEFVISMFEKFNL